MTDASQPETAPDGAPARRQLNLVAILPVALFGLLAVGFLVSLFRGDPSRLPAVMVGKPAPQFTLPAIAGLPGAGPGLSNADLGHGEVSIVNVFASWCAECRVEHPLLAGLSKRFNVKLYGIDQEDPAADANRFLSEFGNPFAKIGADGNGRVSIDWGVYGVPETYVVDANGKIAFKFIGPLTQEAIEAELRPAIERAAKAGS